MTWIQKVLSKASQAGKKIVYPIASIWTDKIIDFIDFETKYKYGKVSFQLRMENNNAIKYLIIEYRGPEGTIWMHLTDLDAIKIKKFLEDNYGN